jgi:hypothetical protein
MNNEEVIPTKLNTKILNDIKSRIFLDIKPILLKLFVVHLVVAIGTLSICPQMGATTFKTNINLMYAFMHYGKLICDLTCGTFFAGTSVLMACIFLSQDELRVIRSNKILAAASLALVSIGGLLILNPSFFLEFSILWLVGVILGSIISFEIGTYFKTYINIWLGRFQF